MPAVELTTGCCPRRRWGKSGLSIPVVPFGTQGFGNNFGPVTDEEACALIRRAVDLGVNHFDCARCYGDSLRKLGVALKTGVIRRDEVVISGRLCCHSAAKWGFYGEGKADYSAARAIEDVRDQLEILGTDHFDAMLIHDPSDSDATLASDGTLAGIKRLKEEGLIHNVGYGMNPHPFHLKVIEQGDIDVLLCFSDYNLLRQTAAEDILPAAAEKDIGVMNGWSIMRGMLTGTPVEKIVSRDRWLSGSDAQRAESMRLWCEERGISLLVLALQFCLRETRIHGNPLGNLNIEQLEMNVAATLTPLDDATLSDFAAAAI
ncbi:aldo/keto reductase [Candidatus Poribacteria bacterium]|nr:aldo/keto reductase [Candidatus Poribacteria bacterium]